MPENICSGCKGKFWWYEKRDYCNNCIKMRGG